MKQRQRFEPWRQLLFPALLLLTIGMAVTACSSEEENLSKDNAQKQILGKWKQMRQGNIDMAEKNITLHFRDDGKVVYSYKSGETDDQGSLSEEIFAYTFEDDWHYDGNKKALKGHMSFLSYDELRSNNPYRFLVWLEGEQLVLTPDMGAIYVMEPTLYFERIK